MRHYGYFVSCWSAGLTLAPTDIGLGVCGSYGTPAKNGESPIRRSANLALALVSAGLGGGGVPATESRGREGMLCWMEKRTFFAGL